MKSKRPQVLGEPVLGAQHFEGKLYARDRRVRTFVGIPTLRDVLAFWWRNRHNRP